MPMKLIEVDCPLAEVDRLDRRDVVWTRALVEDNHASIALEIRHAIVRARCVDGQLLVGDANSVAVCVWVGEEPGL